MENKLEQLGVLVWDEEYGEGFIRIAESFEDEHVITQLDVLKDWIGILTTVYNETLQDFETKH